MRTSDPDFPVAPEASARRSTRITLCMPRDARWKAALVPFAPPPMTTASALAIHLLRIVRIVLEAGISTRVSIVLDTACRPDTVPLRRRRALRPSAPVPRPSQHYPRWRLYGPDCSTRPAERGRCPGCRRCSPGGPPRFRPDDPETRTGGGPGGRHRL